MNCIIVDDDILTCKILEGYVSKSTALNLMGTFSDSIAARDVLTKRQDIDLVILDIQMPNMDGFDFIRSLDFPPNIILISSSEEFALKAFDFNVVDFLLNLLLMDVFVKLSIRQSDIFHAKS